MKLPSAITIFLALASLSNISLATDANVESHALKVDAKVLAWRRDIHLQVALDYLNKAP